MFTKELEQCKRWFAGLTIGSGGVDAALISRNYFTSVTIAKPFVKLVSASLSPRSDGRNINPTVILGRGVEYV